VAFAGAFSRGRIPPNRNVRQPFAARGDFESGQRFGNALVTCKGLARLARLARLATASTHYGDLRVAQNTFSNN